MRNHPSRLKKGQMHEHYCSPGIWALLKAEKQSKNMRKMGYHSPQSMYKVLEESEACGTMTEITTTNKTQIQFNYGLD